MRHAYSSVCAILISICGAAVGLAQPAAKTGTAVPRLVKFSGTLTDGGGKPLSGPLGVTFALYEEQEGGAPVWMETQNVQADSKGKYTALLGATRNEGIPAEVFGSGQRWLGVQAQGEPERPRVLMTSVPYSLKAVDAETLGGLPASAFALAGAAGNGAGGTPSASPRAVLGYDAARPAAAPAAVTGTGTAGTVPLWTSTTALGSSVILQSGGNLGIGRVNANFKLLSESATAIGLGGSTTAASGTTPIGVQGQATATTGNTYGVNGVSLSTSGIGVQGTVAATTGNTYGVSGASSSSSGYGVFGTEDATSGTTWGVYGLSESPAGIGVAGEASATSGNTVGVSGVTASATGYGVMGEATAASGASFGVYGEAASGTGAGVAGSATATTGAALGVYGMSASTTGVGVKGYATATTGEAVGLLGISASVAGYGVQGQENATTGMAFGVSGITTSTQGIGTSGLASATTGTTYGVQGVADSGQGVGVFGVGIAGSALGKGMVGTPAGVWGDTKTGTAGVLATADDTEAVAAYNNATNVATMFVENEEDTKDTAIVLATYSPSYGGYCDVFVSGNLTCSGSVGGHASIPNGAAGPRDVAMYSVQAAENWFEDAGSGQLRNGTAVVALEAEYAQTVNAGMEYHVFLTPKGDCKGLYVTNETAGGFEVHELGGGSSSIAFDYRIMARRKGYENIRMADLTGKIQRGPNPKPASAVQTALPLPHAAKTTADPGAAAHAKPPVHGVRPARAGTVLLSGAPR